MGIKFAIYVINTDFEYYTLEVFCSTKVRNVLHEPPWVRE